MDLVHNGTQLAGGAAALPAPGAASGTPGFANNAAPGLGVVRTKFDPDLANTLIAEIANVVLGAGISLNGGNRAQLWQAITRLARTGYYYQTTNGTLTPDQNGQIVVNASAGNITLTLPLAAAMNGTQIPSGSTLVSISLVVSRVDSSSNTVTLQAQGSDVFKYGSLVGTSWQIPPGATAELFSDANADWIMSMSGVPNGGVQHNAHGTYPFSVPAGVTSMVLQRAAAAGGGGGAAYGSGSCGTGGAAGPMVEFCRFPVVPGQIVSSTVGQGGAGGIGSSTPGAGSAGGVTSVSVYQSDGVTLVYQVCYLTGGGGGAAGLNALSTSFSSAGSATLGSGLTGRVNISNAGAPGILVGSVVLNGLGSGPDGLANTLNANTAGNAGAMPGAGGNSGAVAVGGSGGNNGGAGADGEVVITW